MKLETYLSALCISKEYLVFNSRRFRQFNKFYDRILRMDAEKDKQIKELLEISTKEGLARLEKQDD